MTETIQAQAVMMMSRIRYQVFTPGVTTMGACPRCKATSHGAGVCAECIGKDLDALLGSSDGAIYVQACRVARASENAVLAAAEVLDDQVEGAA